MITTLLFDFSRVLLHPKDTSIASLNDLYRSLLEKPSFDFFQHYELNHEVLNFLKPLKKNYKMYIFTSEIVQNAPEIRGDIDTVFDGVYSAQDFGISKKDPQTYSYIAEKIKSKPEEILFIDDTQANIDAAKKAGMQTVQYNSNAELFQTIHQLVRL